MPQRETRQVRPPVPGEAEWLPLGPAAKYLGVAQSTIRKWSDAGQVPAYTTPGGHRRYRRSDLDTFLERSRGQTGSGPRVLVVDADPGVRALLRERLQAQGCVVEEASSAEEGLRLVGRKPPRLLLLNLRMRRADGWEMLRRIGDDGIPVLTFGGGERGERQDQRGRPSRPGAGRGFDPDKLVERARRILAP
ncbi:MAG: helix-turn-helix domain-containing protein [Gaiellaceae bacterium]